MADMHTVYQLTIRTLSPLHIGTGNKLVRDYDYVTRNGNTWVVDTTALADMLEKRSKAKFHSMATGAALNTLIDKDDYAPGSQLFRYVMERAAGKEIFEQIKDPWDRPYIPGSSLKGALRTTLAWIGVRQRHLEINAATLDSRPMHAADRLEEQILFGKEADPYHNLLRALQISDTTPCASSCLQLSRVKVEGAAAEIQLDLETIKPRTEFTATLTLDGFLLRKSTRKELGWEDDQQKWLRNIAQVVNLFTQDRLIREQERWENIDAPIRSFYQNFNRIRIDESSEFFLQLGWGGGWDSKTFGSQITDSQPVYVAVMDKYLKVLVPKGKVHLGPTFPKTRRVVVSEERPKTRRVVVRDERLSAPLGWIHVKMERVK